MEFFVVLFIIWIVYKFITSSSSPSSSSYEPSLTQLQLRVIDDTVSEHELPVWAVQIKGLMPVSYTAKVGVILSMFDSTGGRMLPVLAPIEQFQEPDGYAFFFSQELGMVSPGSGLVDWATVGIVPKDLLMFPLSGDRNIRIVLRLVDLHNTPPLRNGVLNPQHPGCFVQRSHNFKLHVERGFQEKSEEELAVAAASIRLAIRLAHADGHLAEAEGLAVRKWAGEYLEMIPNAQAKEKAKDFLNDAIRWALSDGYNISISEQCAQINSLGDKPEKYAAMELCLDVMAADGVADEKESEMLSKLCHALGLDFETFREMKDERILHLDHGSFNSGNVWTQLDIDHSLPDGEKKKKLNALYMKWNSRAESLEDGNERERAQQMLDLIAQARHELS